MIVSPSLPGPGGSLPATGLRRPPGKPTGRGLAAIFEPRAVAVVGASADPTKRGHQILRALDASGYAGRVYPVNPRGGRILGREVVSSIEELPEAVDLAVVSVPAAAAAGVVRACGARGVSGAVVLAAGFGESGLEGARREAELRRAGLESGVRIVGPNTSGLMNLPHGLNLIGAQGARPGGIALLVQSGNIALGLLNGLSAARLGVSVCCGLGNEMDVGFGEVLEYLGGDGETQAVVAHIEGMKDSRSFLRSAAGVTPIKPVVVLKSGRTDAGVRAARSHTGALAGPYERLSAGFRQAGVLEVARTDELLPVAAAVASQPPGLPGTGVAILSDGGGQSTVAVDALTELGAPLADLAPETSGALRALLGPAAAVTTPVDVAGAADADPGAFARALGVLAADPGVGIVLLVGMFGGYAHRFSETLGPVETAAARRMARTMRTLGKGFVVQSQYAALGSDPLGVLADARVPVVESLEVACRTAFELQRRGARLVEPVFSGHGPGETLSDGAAPTHTAIAAARAEARVTLSEVESRSVLEASGLRFGPMAVARGAAEAAAAAVRFDQPVAVKLLSRFLTHKSDAGGVELDVAPGEAAAAFDRIAERARGYARSQGAPEEAPAATVAPMLAPPDLELLVGAVRDPGLGPVLTLAAGGVFAEVLGDAAHRVLPVGAPEIEAALDELRAGVLLRGARGRPPLARGQVVEAALAIAACMTRFPEVREVEVNPLFVYPARVAPVDARVVLTPDA